MKILVIRHDVLGDVLVVSCIFRGLKEKYPDCTIDYLCNRGYEAVVANNPYINKIVRQDDGSYDLVLPIDHSTQWDDWMPKVHCRVADVPFHPQEVYFTEAELQQAETYRDCILVSTTAGWGTRRYNHWPEVAKPLMHKYRLVQIDLTKDITPGIEHPQLKVREMMAAIKLAGLYLGIDSLPMHVAAACCTPMVLIMGPTGAEIQYVPCATILRPFAYTVWSDYEHHYLRGIELDPKLVVAETLKKIGEEVETPKTTAVVQYTDEYGYFCKET